MMRGLIFALGVCGVLAACQTVMESNAVGVGQAGSCASHLGSYQLATSRLKITVSASDAEGSVKTFLDELEAAPRADSSRIYCLNHLASGTANDKVVVRRSKRVDDQAAFIDTPLRTRREALANDEIPDAVGQDTSMLQLISSRAIDQSALIARKFIRTGVAIHTNRVSKSLGTFSLRAAGVPDKPKSFEIDPFNPVKMAQINMALRDFGYCVAFGNYTVADTSPAGLARYCKDPQGTTRAAYPPRARIAAPEPPANKSQGVFYRPRQPYSVYVLANPDPYGLGQWAPVAVRTVAMENRAPVLSVGVDRATFAARQTALVFDNGALTDVCMAKGSEVLGAIEIPIELVSGIVRSPITAIRQATNVASARAELAKIETTVIKLQEAQIALEAERATTEQQALLNQVRERNVDAPLAGPISDLSPLQIDTSDLVAPTTGLQKGDRLQDLCASLFAASDFAAAPAESQ
ncbi:hypothetical protein MED193_16959 [Roseobacter sp. MED193]|nr:hypothetical protein MED193_16959 [Roseobacter sp. MED193]